MDWLYPDEVLPDIESGNYYEQAQANRDRRRRHSDFAADIVTRATQAGTNYLLRKGFGKLKDAFMARMAGKRSQTKTMDNAKKKAKNASGASKGRSGNDAGIKPAMFIPGRGAEIPLVTSTFQKPLTLTLGLKSPRLHDPRKALANSFAYMSKSVSTGFAFKAIKAYKPPIPNELQLNEYGKNSRFVPDNTFITTHVFRHKDPRGMSPGMGDNSTLWNYTLGPDNAYARRKPGTGMNPRGTAINPPADFSPLLVTAERFPETQHDMIPRYSIDANEDNCWNLNPCKAIGLNFETPVNAVQGTASGGLPGPLEKYKYVPRAQPMYTFSNTQPPPVSEDQPPTGQQQTFGPQIFQSIPASQTTGRSASWWSTPDIVQIPPVGVAPSLIDNVVVSVGKPDGYYKVQSGHGSVSYTFSNNGTCPVVVDVVVTNLKKGKVIYDSANFVKTGTTPTLTVENKRDAYSKYLFEQVSDGYNKAMVGAESAVILGGQGVFAPQVISDMKQEFLPQKYFKKGVCKSQPNPGDPNQIPLAPVEGGDPPSYPSIPGPQFNFIARDQFIIAPGASKPWRTTLPCMDYDARKYRSFDSDTMYDAQMNAYTGPKDLNPDTPFLNRVVYDDRCIGVSFRFSNVSVPLVEHAKEGTASADVGAVAVIDRGATDINVTATGSYVEHPHPVYKVKSNPEMYAQGVTTEPFYDPTTDFNTVRLDHIDIQNTAAAVRTAGNASAFTQIGATNSQAA